MKESSIVTDVVGDIEIFNLQLQTQLDKPSFQFGT